MLRVKQTKGVVLDTHVNILRQFYNYMKPKVYLNVENFVK